MSQPPPSPDSEAQQREKEDRATQLEGMLRWAGLSDRGIEKLRNGQDRTGLGWQRLAKAVENKYPAMGRDSKDADAVRPAVIEGLRFAYQESSSLQEFAYRYEYFKALYDEQKQDVFANRNDLTNSEKYSLIHRRLATTDVQGVLDADTEIIHSERKAKKVEIDLEGSDEEVTASIRRQADEIGMGHDTSTAYHARKHFLELPREEQKGHPIAAYLKSLAKTIREGEVSSFERSNEDRSVGLTIDRTLSARQGGPPEKPKAKHRENEGVKKGTRVLRARVFVRNETGAIAPTLSKQKAGKGDDYERG
ncbi:hypothetical protein [Nocardiopsis eucommiae]|uniref:hypothetical protein n=1 Tax=Nocardiopsis eucommiae TaxID=2831970 RepID=UPI003D710087